MLFGQGGQIGPDLTAYKRDDLQAMLVNVVNPSAEIREGFENFLVATADGRQLTGFIADRDNRVIVLRGVDGQSITVSQDEIEDMRAIPRSVMPEGVLDPFSDQQIRDLFAYLRSTQPLP
jgi:putative heme-binding domain-containing protein